MTVLFTEEEREWLNREDFNWSLDPDCPESLAGPIKAKLALLYGQEEEPQDSADAENYNHDNSPKPLDNSVNSGRMNTDNPPQTDGGPGSGNHGHKGVPGQRGGSAPSGGSETTAAPVSARGENAPCTGFASKKLLKKHIGKHRKMYPGMTASEYERHAIDFLKQPCTDTLDGFKTESGEVVRFNRKTGEFAKGVPGGNLRTCFIARFNEKTGTVNLESANRYFDSEKKKGAVDDE